MPNDIQYPKDVIVPRCFSAMMNPNRSSNVPTVVKRCTNLTKQMNPVEACLADVNMQASGHLVCFNDSTSHYSMLVVLDLRN